MGRRASFGAVCAAGLAVVVAGCGSSAKKTAESVTSSVTSAYSQASKTVSSALSTASKSASSAVSSAEHAVGVPSKPSTKAVVVGAAKVGSLGEVLVDSAGKTLYIFYPDNHSKVTCTGACATVWPPLKVGSGETVKASGAVKQSLLGSDPDPEGGRVVTYNGWPLYTYVADSSPGMASGEGLNLNGGLWYVISVAGQVVKH